MMKQTFIAIMMLVLAATSAVAQEVVWDVDFSTVFNNREGGDELRPDQTFLFTRLSPEVGIQLRTDKETTHRLMGGVSWYQPINNECKGAKVTPTLYYQFANKNWRFDAGFVPRTQLMEAAPRYLWSDSMNYVQPNIRGVLAQYHKAKSRSYAELYLDWRQLQSETRREAFNVDIDGKAYFGNFWMGGYLQYNHLAKRKNAPENEGVNDDVTVNPMIGYDWNFAKGNYFKVKAGAVLNLERARVDDKWHTPCGFVGNLQGRWKFLELEENVYAGQELFPLWDRFGSLLNLGDTYYQSKFYSRTDLRAHIVQTRFVDLTASLTYHATNKITGFWQQISCRIYFDQNIWKHRRDSKWLREGRLKSIY